MFWLHDLIIWSHLSLINKILLNLLILTTLSLSISQYIKSDLYIAKQFFYIILWRNSPAVIFSHYLITILVLIYQFFFI